MNNNIIGKWELDPKDTKSLQEYGKVNMEFKTNGELIYKIDFEKKEQIIFMTYEINEKTLITNQPTFLQKEETEYSILQDGILVLNFGGIASRYIKVF